MQTDKDNQEDLQDKSEIERKTQQNANKATNVVKRNVKKVTKIAIKEASRTLLIGFKALPLPVKIGIIIFTIIFIIVGISLLAIEIKGIQETEKVTKNTIDKYSVITDEGIEFDKDAAIDELMEELKDWDYYNLSLGSNEERAREYLEYFIKATIISEFPYIEGNDNKYTQGIVHIKRKRSENTPAYDLKYIGYEEFLKKFEQKDKDIKNYYTIDNNWKLCVAKSRTVTINEVETEYDLVLVEIPYRNMVSQYGMPMSFLLTLLMRTHNPEYVKEVANLVNRDSMVELTVFDSIEKDTTIYTYKHSTMSKWIEYDIDTQVTSYHRTTEPVKQEDEVTITVVETGSISANVTKANTWAIKQQTEYDLDVLEDEAIKYPLGIDGITNEIPDEPEPEGDVGTWKVEQSENTKIIVDKEIWKSVTTTNKLNPAKFLSLWRNSVGYRDNFKKYISDTNSYIYVTATEDEKKYKGEENGKIVGYTIPETEICDYPINNIDPAIDMTYAVLEESESAQIHLELLKEMKAIYDKGEDIEEEENIEPEEVVLDIFDPDEFLDVGVGTGTGSALENFLKAWEGTRTDANGNYKVFNDGSGNATIGYGICIKYNISILNEKGLYELTNFRHESELFGKVVIGKNDLIDQITRQLIDDKRQRVVKETMGLGLSETQIDALTAIVYQYGNIGNFVSQYKIYQNTEELREHVKSNSGARYFKVGIPPKRGEANWKLFHEGIYTDSQGNVIAGSNYGNSGQGSGGFDVNIPPDIDLGSSSENVKIVIEAALSQLGVPYRWGAMSPGIGFDCSGLVHWAYKQAGIEIPRTTGSMEAALSSYKVKEVSLKYLKPGDILWKQGHVGLYLGNNKFIHAPGKGQTVKIAEFLKRQETNYRFTVAYRIFP